MKLSLQNNYQKKNTSPLIILSMLYEIAKNVLFIELVSDTIIKCWSNLSTYIELRYLKELFERVYIENLIFVSNYWLKIVLFLVQYNDFDL